MMFWIASAALTLLAIVLAFLPAFRASAKGSAQASGQEFSHDIEVYRDQLAELEAERKAGTISGNEATQAHAEIARRLLAAQTRLEQGASDAGSLAAGRTRTIVLVAIALVFVPVLTFILYTGLGSPQMPAAPLQARLDAMRQQRQVNDAGSEQMRELVAKAETHLAQNPEDGRGWDVLAPVYYRLGDDVKAEEAYRNAMRLLGETPARLSGLGEVLVAKTGGVVTGEAATLFQRAISLDGTESRSQYFLALAQMQSGNISQARSMWQALASNESADPNWRSIAGQTVQRMAEVEAAEARDASRPPALDQETIKNAGQMDAGSQQAMISGMVAQLDERLSAEGGSVDEWKRLIRARSVLGDKAKTDDALGRALAAFSGKPAETDDLKAFALSLGIELPSGGAQ